MFGLSDTNDGIAGQSGGAAKSGGFGFNTDIAGFGVFGLNTANNNVAYLGGGFAAAAGFSADGDGLHGESGTANGVVGVSNSGDGVLGQSSAGFAGHFIGNVQVTGNLSKGGGSFKIDHPLDPENKYLSHSFVESPDMMNIYNGNVTLDQQGEAVVKLPEWFQTLNRDFRYSLTAIGAPAPNLFIAEEVAENRFKIAGGAPGVRVSWQITGIRQDPYANKNRIKIEEEKPERERGRYLQPELYGEPEEKGIGWVRTFRVMQQTNETVRRSGKD